MSSESTIEKDSKKSRAAAEGAEIDDDELDAEGADTDDDEGDDDSETNGHAKVSPALSREKAVVDRPNGAKMVWTIMRRELAGYFHSPITYIVGGVTFLIFGVWFFYQNGAGFWDIGRASMTPMFDIVPWALCGIIPLYTMRSLSDEKRVGTIELLITMPVKDQEVILGKYFAALLMVVLQIALLSLYPLAMFKFPWHIGELDWGAFWVAMLGLMFLAAAGTAIGLMWSSFTESQILSFFAAALTLLALMGLGKLSLVEGLRGWMGDALAFVSTRSRFESFARGIVDTRAIVYFLSLTVLALLVAFRMLERRKWA
jgi:ABC-2 type transport system permease protein